jgi:PKD repeat protein
VVVSDGDGQARTTITTNRDSTVTATAGGRAEGQAVTAQVTITAVALPTVSVSVTTANPTVGQPVVFSVSATSPAPGSIRNATIDFGDGSTQTLGAISQATNVAHTYRSAGTFTVTVRAEDTNGANVTDRQGNPAPVQRITVDWGDGDSQALGGLQGTHVYQRAATFLIRVTVTLTDGSSGSGTAAVQVFPP